MDEARAGQPDRARFLEGAVTLFVGGVFFVLAFQNGSYGTTTWAAAAVLVWWTLGLVAVDVLPGRRPRGTALVTGTLLSLLGVWALLSTQWAADADAAYLQAAQVALYAGAFFLVATTATREAVPRILDGIALAIVGIALVALVGRLFPGFASTGAASRALPAVIERLSWPVGYWNGLAMLVALGLPLLLRTVADARSRVVAAASVAAIPLIVADLYLSSSRGGVIVGVVAVATFVALVRDRLPAMAAAAVGVVGGVTAVLALEWRPVLVNGPFASHAATVAGREVAALLVAVVAATGVAWMLVDPVVRRIPAPSRRVAVGLGGHGRRRSSPRRRVVASARAPALVREASRGVRHARASYAPISSAEAAAAAGSSGPLQSTSGGRRRSSAPAPARSPRGGPSTDPCRCSSATRIRSTSKASASWEP